MGTLAVTNLTSSEVWLSDLYTRLPASSTITCDRAANQIASLADLTTKVAAGTVSYVFTPTAAEIAAGTLQPEQSIQAADMAPVAATAVASGDIKLYMSIPASGTDIAVYAANALPFKFRILDAHLVVTAGNSASRTVTLYTAASASGPLGIAFDCANAGRIQGTMTDAPLLTPGALVGLYANKSNSAIAGKLVLTVRRES